MYEKTIIAIDGPAGSGKSSVARAVAKQLGMLYLDSGAIYRAVTLMFLRQGIAPGAPDTEVQPLLEGARIELARLEDGFALLLNGEDVSALIRGADVTAKVSEVSGKEIVRSFVTSRLRQLGQDLPGVVMDGRDIGTVVFPDAELKIYLTASLQVRAKRRRADLKDEANGVDLNTIMAELAARDKYDSEREIAPLRQAEGAIFLDTSNMTQGEVVDFIANKFESLICQS